MNSNTTTLKDTYMTAYENYKKGHLKNAETLCYKILSIDPNFLQSKILLANISAKNEDFIKTTKLYSYKMAILNNSDQESQDQSGIKWIKQPSG